MSAGVTLLLVRHGLVDAVGHSFAGRAAGHSLNAVGRAQVARLAERLAGVPFAAVYSSPLERARETAAAVAHERRLEVQVDDALTELDVGAWTGRTFGELHDAEHADAWRRFNSFRSGTRAGGAELMLDAQVRVVGALLSMRERHAGQVVAAVSHADVIKSAVAYFAGIPLDLAHRLEISPASVTTLTLDAEGARLLGMNGERAHGG